MQRREFLRQASLTSCAGSWLAIQEWISGRAQAAQYSATARRGEPIPWLADVQSWSRQAPTAAPGLAPVEADQPLRRQHELRNWWQQHLGLRPTPTRPPSWKLLHRETVDDVVRQLIRYESEPGWEVEAYLLQPSRLSLTAPGFVVFHSTVEHSIRQPAGLSDEPEKALGWELAKLGYTALCPRNFLWPTNEKLEVAQQAGRFCQQFPQSTGMAKMLWDASVAVSLLASLPGVDPQRLGAIGHSLGGKEVLYLAAWDERIRATVSSEGGIGVSFSNWDAPWYLGSAAATLGPHDHHELLALIAPRPFLLVGGDSADGTSSEPYLAAAWPLWEARSGGQTPALGLLNHRAGHALPAPAAARSLAWLAHYC